MKLHARWPDGEGQKYAMDMTQEEEGWQPVSPTGQYFNSSVLSISVLGILETEVPIDDSLTIPLLKNVFLPINPRFSSVMINDEKGVKRWKRVEVNLTEHVNVPTFPDGMSPKSYDEFLNDYLSNISTAPFPQTRPLWELHIIKYPTSRAAGTVVFKLHHALGDGYSLIGALLSCLQRADDPSLPLTFPSLQKSSKAEARSKSLFKSAPRIVSAALNSVLDFGSSLLKSTLLADHRSPIRSGDAGVQFRPITLSTMAFSLDRIKQIKTNLGVTINDVITGIIFLGIRLYMQGSSHGSSNARSTALVLLNTRIIEGYKSINEMVKPNAQAPWGNRFAFLHVTVPKLNSDKCSDPLYFVRKAHKTIKRKRSSSGVFLIARLLETIRKFRGPEVTAKYIHRTLKNSSMAISNLIGPVEQLALANHPIKGLYFMVVGAPQSLQLVVMSYMGSLRVAVGMEKGLMDPQKFNSCMENAFEMIFKAACQTPSQTNSKDYATNLA